MNKEKQTGKTSKKLEYEFRYFVCLLHLFHSTFSCCHPDTLQTWRKLLGLEPGTTHESVIGLGQSGQYFQVGIGAPRLAVQYVGVELFEELRRVS